MVATGGRYEAIDGRVQRLAVRRKRVWQDTLMQMQQPKFRCNAKLHVRFIGEEAEDGGGPRREYFRLVLKAIAHSSLFYGPDGHRTPMRNAIARQRGHYKMAGSVMAMSLVQEGPAPSFLNHAMVQYMCGKREGIQATIAQVPDIEVQEKLKMVKSACQKIGIIPNALSCVIMPYFTD